MDNIITLIKDKLKEPRNLAIAAAVVGLVLGLIIGWGVWPVRWTDTTPETLREDLRVEYLRNAITTFSLTNDVSKAKTAFEELGTKAEDTMKYLVTNPGFLNQEIITRFNQAVTGTSTITLGDGSTAQVDLQTPSTAGTQIAPIVPGPAPKPEEKSGGLLYLGLVLLAILVIGGGLVYYFYFRNRVQPEGHALEDVPASPGGRVMPMRPAAQTAGGYVPAAVPARPKESVQPMAQPQAQMASPAVAAPVQPARTGYKPVAQFMTTYMFGDDLYDESFTFDAPNGEFLGECGVSISDIIGVGEPKKISAFEVWLFDKNDVQTVTKVVMSKHTFQDPASRQRLELKGEPVMADVGRQMVLETATLRLEAQVVDVVYGEMPLPEQSYFQRMTIELSVFNK